MPLFVNQSTVLERENSEIPQREEDDGGVGGGGVAMEGLTEEVGTSKSFSESRSFSGRRLLGVHE